MTNPHGSFIWYELMTADPDASKAFYDATVGWKIEDRPSGDLDYRMITIPGGENAGGVLGMTAEMLAKGGRAAWIGYVGVDDVDALVRSAEQSGGMTLMPAFDMPGVGRMAMIADPQGAPIYVMKPTPSPGNEGADSTVFSVDKPMHVRWNELATTDPDGAIAFYKAHFGWQQEGAMEMGDLGTYRFVQHGGVGIGAVMPTMPQAPVSRWSFYFGVEDIDRAATAVTAGGGTVIHGPIQIPGGEYSLNATDPQGVPFGLVGPRHGERQS